MPANPDSPAPSPAASTLRKIARETGYALATVSYALRNHPKVRPETRLEIQAAAERLGYRPNPLVTSVMAQVRAANPPRHGGTLVCLSHWQDAAAELDADACARFIQGARDRATARGWQFEDMPCDRLSLRGPRLTQILQSRGIQGLLVGPLRADAGELDLDWTPFACATWGYSLRAPSLHRAVSHHGHAIALAFHHARQHGARRIGLALPAHLNARADHLYEGAFHIAQKDLPPRLRVTPFLPANTVAERRSRFVPTGWNAAAFLRWLDTEKPDAVLATKDILPLLARLRRRAAPPEIIALDHSSFPADAGMAGVDFCHRAVGESVVDLIITQLNA
ncbi:MAG: LacI family DNA-binding transcriptional regulator, partial [Burkholderiales bacterium]|nr:LacI family DNA-binding transcriptional regulator [Opitutaceae bacterium]